MPRTNWSREELIVAFNLYCKIPFGKIHNRNPLIIQLANAVGRTPSAVSWKLANFARLDPALQERNIVGASHGSQAEVELWKEFNGNWEGLAFESECLLRRMTGGLVEAVNDESCEFPAGGSREMLVRTRINQGFFRSAILAAYRSQCCITGLAIPQLLNASHIVPWSVDVNNRTNPRNGLCLNAIHDRAFDCGLLTVTVDMRVRISARVADDVSDTAASDLLLRYDGAPILLPQRFVPHQDFLRYHNERVFQS